MRWPLSTPRWALPCASDPRRRQDCAQLQASIIAVAVYDWKRGSGLEESDPGGNDMMRPALLAALMSAALPVLALAQSADDLKTDEKTPADVLTYGMGYSAQRYS